MLELLILLSFALLAVSLKWSAGCTCTCETCDLFADDFSTDNLATDWDNRTEDAYSVSGGVASTSTDDSLLIANQAHTSAAMHVTVDVSGDTDGQEPGAIVAYTDDNNYLYAQIGIDTTAAVLQIFSVVSGTPTLLEQVDVGEDAPSGTTHTLEVCYSDGILSAFFLTYVASAAVSATGTKGGIKVGTVVSGTVTFDNFILQKAATGSTDLTCPRCIVPSAHECTACVNDEQPEHYKVVLAGIGNEDCPIAGANPCTNLNGTYILPASSVCGYNLQFFADTCSSGQAFCLTLSLGSGVGVNLSTGSCGGSTVTWSTWVLSQSEPQACMTYSDLDIPHSTDPRTECDFSAATCTVTAINN